MPFAPHEVYSRSLLPNAPGYPLWTPQLKTQLCENYQLEGLRIGDVGIVSSNDGSFDVLFNITLERSEQPYPELVRENFTPVVLDQKRDLATQPEAVAAHGVISSASVKLLSREVHNCGQKPLKADFEFSSSMEDGAVLILPEGAESSDLENEKKFRDEAIRHGIEWYECVTEEAGRFINNDSLYLLTGVHKARSWSLGAAGRDDSSLQERRNIKFKVGEIHQDGITAEAYFWVTTHGFMERVGPKYPYEIPNYIRDERLRRGVNQTVFIRGFRITVNKILFLKTVSVKTRQGTFFGFGNFVDSFLWGRPTPSSCTEGGTDNTVAQDYSLDHGRLYMDTHLAIDRIPDVAQTFHPGDSINQYMLRKEPHVMIALTHDSLWIEMLRMGLLDITDFSHEERLARVLSTKYRTVVEDGAVYLERGPSIQDFDLTSLSGALASQAEEETLAPEEQPQYPPSSLNSAAHADENNITSIRVTDITLGIRRVPAGFYTIIRHSGHEWRTDTKRSFVNDDVVEWSGLIPIPSDPSATVCFEVYGSFECQPMLGDGECLRKLTRSVEVLLDHSAQQIPFTLFPKDDDIVSPCSSILATVEQRKGKHTDSLLLRDPDPYSHGKLENATTHGHQALSHYQIHGRKQDLENSVAEFEHALCICPLDHPCRPAAQSNLAMSRSILCQVKDKDVSLEVSIGLYGDALAARPVGHVDRPSTLIQLAAALLAQSEKGKDGVESARAVALLHEAQELSAPDSHENRAANFILQLLQVAEHGVDFVQADQSLAKQDLTPLFTEESWTLSGQLLDCFKESGNTTDLQQSITILWELATSTSDLDHRYSMVLRRLGMALWLRFNCIGDLHDLEEAIFCYKDAVHLTPHGHPDRPTDLNDLGNIFITRFQRLGELGDLEDAIPMFREAVDLTLHDHPERSARLKNLGTSLLTRFNRLGGLSDLEESVSILKDAVCLTPDGDPNKPAHLSDFGDSLVARFERLGELNDLEDAISMLRHAVHVTPQNHPSKPGRLNNLANSLAVRFRHLGGLTDLEDAISALRNAVDLTPHGYLDKMGLLNNLGNSLFSRFQHLGELEDLEDAISMFQEVVDLTPNGHPSKPGYLNNLSSSLVTRFERLGKLSDLESSISTLKTSIDLTPDGHLHRPDRLNNLSISFSTRFERLGDLSDLEVAISMLKDAVDLTPHGHPDRSARLKNLGNSFLARFKRLGELTDLENAILMLKEAVDFTPDGHPNKPAYLNNLGDTFVTRFERLGELSDLEAAISMLKDAIDLTPLGHPDRPTRLKNLGNSLLTRFKRLGKLTDLENAISMLKDAIDLTPHGHPDRPARLKNLGGSFLARFKRLEELTDLENAILMLKEAVDFIPDGHPDEPAYLNDLGDAVVTRFQCLGEQKDLDNAILFYSCAASSSVGPVRLRFHVSQRWISCARRMHHPSLLQAYSIAIGLFSQLAWTGLSLIDRQHEITKGADLVREAAATALDSTLPETAVEWLEQGRSIVWGALAQLRSSFDELSCVHPEHARRLAELSAALAHADATHEEHLPALLNQSWDDSEKHAAKSLQARLDGQRTLALERENLLREIRHLPGFECFLLLKQFSQLRASAHSGPVVFFNAAESRCDALIILSNVDHVVHVPLPNLTLKQIIHLLDVLRGLLPHGRQDAASDTISWESLLADLWKDVVKPVLDALAFSTSGELSRIFWCPTGLFASLPIHAAGLYDTQHSQPGHKVSDFVVSSYVPTLSILASSPSSSVTSDRDLRLLAVRQPASDGLRQLPGVGTELQYMKEVIRSSPLTHATLMESSSGTVEEVLSLMKETDWAHFACHGIQDTTNPTNSGFCLADGRRLKVADIVALSRPRGGLAVLSACQGVVGDKGSSEASIHLAAGMLFAGYEGAVGSMWSPSDRFAPDVVRDVYEQLLSGTRPDCRGAARALHDAVGRLRDSGKASFYEWIPFIHVGL